MREATTHPEYHESTTCMSSSTTWPNGVSHGCVPSDAAHVRAVTVSGDCYPPVDPYLCCTLVCCREANAKAASLASQACSFTVEKGGGGVVLLS